MWHLQEPEGVMGTDGHKTNNDRDSQEEMQAALGRKAIDAENESLRVRLGGRNLEFRLCVPWKWCKLPELQNGETGLFRSIPFIHAKLQKKCSQSWTLPGGSRDLSVALIVREGIPSERVLRCQTF